MATKYLIHLEAIGHGFRFDIEKFRHGLLTFKRYNNEGGIEWYWNEKEKIINWVIPLEDDEVEKMRDLVKVVGGVMLEQGQGVI